jgi:hypothetical protein
VVLLAAALYAPSAFAQGAPAEPVARDAGHDHDRFCRDRWFDVSQCRERTWDGPELMLGLDLGVSAMNETGPFGFGKGVGSATDAGPAWGLRVGAELFPWLAVEGRYVGMYNATQASVSPGTAFLTTGGEAVARLTAPLPYVHPYIFMGGGYYDVALVGSSSTGAPSPFNSSSQFGVPMGFGLDVPLTWHLSLGAEATYHFLIHESFSSVTTNGIDGGDLSTVNLVVRARL